MFGPLRIPLPWKELARRTFNEMIADNALDLSAQLAYYFFLALFIVVSFSLVIVGPTLAETLAQHLYLGPAFEWTWKILQWPVVFGLVSLAMAMIYYFAPDAKQSWLWIMPGAIVATVLWLGISLAFKLYIARFNSYDNATYGILGGVIVL